MELDARDPTWRYPWPAGLRMAEDLPRLLDWKGARVLELGCGQGLVGQAALRAGATCVTFTDISQEPLDHLGILLGTDHRVRLVRHAWGDTLPEGPYDVVVGGDILYRPAYFDRLIHSIDHALEVGGEALLGDPRSALEPELASLLIERGFHVQTERRDGPYTLLRAQRIAAGR